VGAFDCVERQFLDKELKMLEPGRRVTTNIVFEPRVYELARGHTLRLTLTGADKDNFDVSAIPVLWNIRGCFSDLFSGSLVWPSVMRAFSCFARGRAELIRKKSAGVERGANIYWRAKK
jgi:hypothetical protein